MQSYQSWTDYAKGATGSAGGAGMWGNWINGVWNTKQDWQPAITECQCNSAPLPCYGPWPFGSGYTFSNGSQFPCRTEAEVSFPGYAYLELVFLVLVAIIAGSCFLCCTGRSRLLLAPFLSGQASPVVVLAGNAQFIAVKSEGEIARWPKSDGNSVTPPSCCGVATRAVILVLILVVTLGLVGIEAFVKSRWHPGCFIDQSNYNAVDAARMLAEMPDKPMGLASDLPHDFSAVATGWHSKCNGIVDKGVIEAALGPLPSGDALFHDNAFSKYNMMMNHLSDIEFIVPAERPMTVQTLARIVAVNLFTTPLWFVEMAGPMIIPYQHCAYVNRTSRITLVPDTGRGAAVVLQTFKKEGGASDRFAYQYDVTSLPLASLVGRDDNDPYGVTRFSMRLDTAPEGGENCLIWSIFDTPGRSSYTAALVPAIHFWGPLLALLVVVDLVLVCTRTFSLYATVAALVSSGFIRLVSIVRRGREML